MITLDGSDGEGGGQILRTALGLSMVTGTPFIIDKIRARRSKPGLMRQHRAAVLAAADICGARVSGADIGFSRVSFEPGPVRPGEYQFTIGTAGSTTLLFQAILPALMTARGPSRIDFTGGTHNPFAPPLDFLDRVFLPHIRAMGVGVTLTVERPGFYPAGGGRWTADITPASTLRSIDISSLGAATLRRCTALVSALPGEIGVRELDVCRSAFDWPPDSFRIDQLPEAYGPGNVLMIELGYEHVAEICTGFGERGTRAESVAHQCVNQVKGYLAAGAPVGEHLADQLLVPMAMAGGGSFIASKLSQHAMTNLRTIAHFIENSTEIEEVSGRLARVVVRR